MVLSSKVKNEARDLVFGFAFFRPFDIGFTNWLMLSFGIA
jgi:hypothetical protein